MNNIDALEKAIKQGDARIIAVRMKMIRGDLEAYAKLQKEHEQLILRYAELKDSQKQEPSDSNWPSPGLIH